MNSDASIDFAKRIAQSKSAADVKQWKRSIWSEDALRGVITHLRGMAVEATDPARQSQLQGFIRILAADDNDVPPVSIAFPAAGFGISVALIIGLLIGRRLGLHFPAFH